MAGRGAIVLSHGARPVGSRCLQQQGSRAAMSGTPGGPAAQQAAKRGPDPPRRTQHVQAQLQRLGAQDAGGVQARQVAHLLLWWGGQGRAQL